MSVSNLTYAQCRETENRRQAAWRRVCAAIENIVIVEILK